MRPRLAALVAAVLIGALGAPQPGAAAAQGEEPGLGIRLADGEGDPRSRVYIVDHVEPGTSVERTVEVVNEAGRALDVDVYAAGAHVRDGSFAFSERREGNELTSWTSIEPGTVTTAPGSVTRVRVTIAVPPGTTPGERYGVVWAALEPGGEAGDAVRVVHRVGVRMYVSVGSGAAPVTDFEIDSLRPRRSEDGRPTLVAAVRNTGGRAIDLGGELSLADGPSGVSAGPFPVDRPTTLAPADSADVVVSLPVELAAGPWRAQLTLRSGSESRTVEGVVTFPAAGGEGAAVRATPVGPLEDRGVVGPVAAALAVLVAAGAMVTLVRRRRAGDDGPVRAPG